MLITRENFSLLSIALFVLDNVMYLEAFRWERLDTGHIYIQKFPNGKMYAGLTTNLKRRMNDYKNLNGNNKHHTKALKKHIDTMQISFTQCPNYLLDTVEIFVIAFYDLTDPAKGYNKSTGGRKNPRHSKEVRMIMSESKKGEKNPMFGRCGELAPMHGKTHSEGTRTNISSKLTGRKLPETHRANISIGLTGHSHTIETRAKMSIKHKGKKFTDEHRANLSESNKSGKNTKAKPLCAFGKLYGSAGEASNILRDVCNTKDKGNFMSKWVRKPEHYHNVFYVSKKFYKEMKDTVVCITHDMYDTYE